MAIVVPDILISDGAAFRSLRGNAVADSDGVFRRMVTGCGVSDGRDYYVLGDYSVEAVGRVCNRIPEPVTVSNFDYLVFRYIWTDSAGRDLDTATVIREPLDLTIDGELVGNVAVGWGFSSYEIGSVIKNAGDNRGSGNETVVYDFRKFAGLDADVVPSVMIESYATWFSARYNGNIQIEIKAYKGGLMNKDEPNYDYVNIGGTLVFSQTTDFINVVTASSNGPNHSVSDYGYSHTLTLVYDTRTQVISLTPYYSVG